MGFNSGFKGLMILGGRYCTRQDGMDKQFRNWRQQARNWWESSKMITWKDKMIWKD